MVMSGVGPIFPGHLEKSLCRLTLCCTLTSDRTKEYLRFVLPEVKLVLTKLQVFSFTLLDRIVSADLGEKRVFSSGFFSFLLGKLVGNLQVSSILRFL